MQFQSANQSLRVLLRCVVIGAFANCGLPATELSEAATPANLETVQKIFIAMINVGLKENPLLQPIQSSRVPEYAAARSLLVDNSSCALAVGGSHAKTIVEDLETANFYVFSFPAAMRMPDGRSLAFFALSNPLYRAILLLNPFLSPTAAKTLIQLDHSIKETDLLQVTESAHGFRPVSLTVPKLRVLILLHEMGHLSAAIPDDVACLSQSMLNTRHIAKACMPDLLVDLAESAIGETCLVPQR